VSGTKAKTGLEAEIDDITRTIWGTLFDLALNAARPSPLGPESVVTGCVQIVGRSRGAVMLRCPMSLACTLAEQMFRAGSAPSLDDVRDALGELTNVIAGNVKALLPGPSQLSLPAVAVGSDYDLEVVDAGDVTTVSFTCDGQPLMVILFEGARTRTRDPVVR
jgi:chemotaxis protein CheX